MSVIKVNEQGIWIDDVLKVPMELGVKQVDGVLKALDDSELSIDKLGGKTLEDIEGNIASTLGNTSDKFKFKFLADTTRSTPERWMVGVNYNNQIIHWGRTNTYIQGSDGSANDTLGAKVIIQDPDMLDVEIVKIVPYWWGMYVLYANRDLYFLGYGGNGQSGLGNTTSQYKLIKVLTDVISLDVATAGYHQDNQHALALRKYDDGSTEVWGTGRNGYGQLGLGNTTSPISTWTKVTFDTNYNPTEDIIVEVYANLVEIGSSYIRTEDGKLFATGRNADGQLGLGDTTNRNVFTLIRGQLDGKKVVQLVTSGGTRSGDGGYYRGSCVALIDTKQVYAWGYGGNGELGLGDTTSRNTPTEITTLADKNIVKLFGYRGSWTNHFALAENGDPYAWGYNNYGSLGIGNETHPINIPTKVQIGEPIIDIALGAGGGTYCYHQGTLFVTETNKLYYAGYSGDKQDGQITASATRTTPTRVILPSTSQVKQISTGGYSSAWFWVVLLENGEAYAWGDNDNQTSRLYSSTGNIGTPSLIGL